eukprot:c15489_g1_i1.p1 GENE.c15489_g1_i1~~c15489_g1_i1.p1  ORF type:complete len:735 (+),score=195.96 c15489_g1_i1:133-2337(+)
MAEAAVRVVCRFRPLNEREKKLGMRDSDKDFLRVQKSTVTIREAGGSDRMFTLSRCLGLDTTQSQLFDVIAAPSMMDLFQGFNVTLFAYGQTGSGKSFSMFGDIRSPEFQGLVPRCCDAIFNTIHKLGGAEFSIMCSYCEIYQEKISDLLDPERNNLEIRENATKGIYVENLSWEYVVSAPDIFRLIAMGDANKVRRATKMNPNSSRSHCSFCVRVCKKERSTGRVTQTDLNLVDLAGSERIKKTEATGQTLEEAKKINLSLTALSQCIHALTSKNVSGKAAFVPFRQSKLTRLLQDSLGGNSKTCMLVACSPHPDNIDETITSLQFAERCSNVKNKPVVNTKLSLEELQATLIALRSELDRAKSQKKYEKPEMFDKHTSTTEDMVEEFNALADKVMEKQVEIELKMGSISNLKVEKQEIERQIEIKQLEIDSRREAKIRRESLPQRQTSLARRASAFADLRSLMEKLDEADDFDLMSPAYTEPKSKTFQFDMTILRDANVANMQDDLVYATLLSVGPKILKMDEPAITKMTPAKRKEVLQIIVLEQQKLTSASPAMRSVVTIGTESIRHGVPMTIIEERDHSQSIDTLTSVRSDDGEGLDTVRDNEVIKIETKVTGYEQQVAQISKNVEIEERQRFETRFRLSDQREIMDRQKEVLKEYELEAQLLEDTRRDVQSNISVLQEKIQHVQQKLAALEEEREKRRKSLEEKQPGPEDSKAEEGVLSGAMGFFTKLF